MNAARLVSAAGRAPDDWGCVSRRVCLTALSALSAPAAWLVAATLVPSAGELEGPPKVSVSAPPRAPFFPHRGPLSLRALARRNERRPAPPQARMGGPPRLPADRLVRIQACRAGCVPGAGPDPGGECVPQIRGVQRGRTWLHAGHALLDTGDWGW